MDQCDKLKEKVEKYEKLTAKGLKEIKIKKGLNESQNAIAKDFLSMANNYFNDAKYFKKEGFARVLCGKATLYLPKTRESKNF